MAVKLLWVIIGTVEEGPGSAGHGTDGNSQTTPFLLAKGVASSRQSHVSFKGRSL